MTMTVRDAHLIRFAITSEQAVKEREVCYRQKRYRLDNYTYPKGATLYINTPHRLITEDLSGVTHNAYRKRMKKVKKLEKNITAYIIIPSKANRPSERGK